MLKHLTYLKRFVKQIFDTARDSNDESEGVPDDVQAEDDDVSLLDGLAVVVSDHVGHQVLGKKIFVTYALISLFLCASII